MSITQQDRMMTFSTPGFAEDFLLINKMSATEGISELFRFDVELLHEESKKGDEPTVLDVKKILGQGAGIAVGQREGIYRFFNGIISHFSQGNRDADFTIYYATIVPDVWVLTQKAQSRIFQHMSVPDILKKVFTGFKVNYELQGTFDPRNYCVQYRETDFDFASRLMEEEGIYYYFEHDDKGHTMIVANTPQSHKDCPRKTKIPFFLDVSDKEDFISSIRTWQVDYKVQPGVVRLWDHCFELPGKKLEAEKKASLQVKTADDKLEIYDYPGEYAKRYDGIDKAGGEQASNIQKIFQDNQRTTSVRMQEIDAQYKIASGVSDCCTLTAGYRFELEKHPNNDFNGQYVLVSVTHQVEQSPTYDSGMEVTDAYRNSFTCIPLAIPFRPRRKTLKPVVQGSQTATVVGPAGEEIFTDKYGRVKVQFHWDRDGKNNADSSCWMRVAQGWAGKRWGSIFIPRIGMDCIVDFLEGDPDRPIIVGAVYNAETMPPYKLPDEKTKSTIKSDSSPGGGGFNELRFEDKKGKEQIFIHGERNLDVRIKKDSFEWIGNDRHLIVVKDKLEKVGGDKHLKILGDRNEQVTGTVSLKADQDLQEKIGMNWGFEAGQAIHLKAGMTVTIEAGLSLTLKAGSNFINLGPQGIAISGSPTVLINSGGTPGSGAGAKPDAPKEAQEADKANPGERVGPPPPSPPKPVFTYSPAALTMKLAASTGTPFCDI